MSARRSAIQYKPSDVLYLWLVTQPAHPILIGELHLIRTTKGVSLRYSQEWLERGFPLSEDLPLIDEELIPTESGIASGANTVRSRSACIGRMSFQNPPKNLYIVDGWRMSMLGVPSCALASSINSASRADHVFCFCVPREVSLDMNLSRNS